MIVKWNIFLALDERTFFTHRARWAGESSRKGRDFFFFFFGAGGRWGGVEDSVIKCRISDWRFGIRVMIVASSEVGEVVKIHICPACGVVGFPWSMTLSSGCPCQILVFYFWG